MRARLGINNCFAVKRWPLASEWASIVRQDLGLDIVELSLDTLPGLTDPARTGTIVESTRAALDRYALTVEATFTGLSAYSFNLLMHPDERERDAAERWFEAVIDGTAALGARATGGHVGAMSVAEYADPRGRSVRWAALKHHLGRLSAHARKAGLDHFLVENLAAAREPSTFITIDDLLTEGDAGHVPIRLCLDVGHQVVPGASETERDPYVWLARYAGRLAEVQLQQGDGEADHHWPFTAERNRTGRIDPGRVLDTLDGAGADDVLLVIEVIPAFEAPDESVVADLQETVAVWRAALTERHIDG